MTSSNADATLRLSGAAKRVSRTSALAVREACLVLIHGGELGRRYPIKGPMTIGRDATNDLVLDRSDVSRQHAAIMPSEGGWAIADFGSTNGTDVNDEPVQGRAELESGDIVRVGGSLFKYLAGGNVEALFFDEIHRLTLFDGLTGVHNRRSFDEFLEREVARSRRHGNPLCLALFDIDHFKKFNDQHGHLAGDEVLRGVAQRVQKLVRREEMLARYGGEEFGAVIPEVGADRARIFCDKALRAVAEAPFESAGNPLHVTVSIGLAEWAQGMSREDLVRAADEALYAAKDGGRNQLVVHGQG